jgi:hypothetical protein
MVLPNGALLAVIGANGDWFKVTESGKTGYVPAEVDPVRKSG